MKYLLDTHSFLWFIAASKELSDKAESIIRDGQNDILVSIATLWEISIKNSLGKMPLDDGYERLFEHLTKNDFELLTSPLNTLFDIIGCHLSTKTLSTG